MKTPRNARFGNPIDRENGLGALTEGHALTHAEKSRTEGATARRQKEAL
jgi:hypothetical protein